MALLYEIGFGEVYGMPRELLSPTFFTLIFTFGDLLVYLVTPSFFILALWVMVCNKTLRDKSLTPIHRRLGLMSPLFGLLIMVFYGYGEKWREGLPVAYLIFVIALAEFGVPLLNDWRPRKYLEVIREFDSAGFINETLFGRVSYYIGASGLAVVLSVTVAGFASYHYGRASGLSKRKFLVLNSSPELVVLRIYGDRMICAPFDRASRKIITTFAIMSLGETAAAQLRPEEIGPLLR